uniref:Uncharacterized protein n=1 Tax=Caenorhabditis tropicalis TaxID=1561998 RepID=A0A1I7T0C2_9PELO
MSKATLQKKPAEVEETINFGFFNEPPNNELTSTKDITDENPTHDVDSDPINVDCPAELKSDMPGVEKEKRKETKKKKNEKKRNRSDKKKEEETEDEMLDRLIKENQEASKQQLIEDKFVASLRDSTKSYQKGRKQKVTEKKSSEVEKDKNGLQELVTGKIAELEQKSFLEMFFAECSYGELVVETVKRAVNSFIDDIESVISKGMHPDNVKNKMYHLFEKMVVLPTPNEEIKTAAQRFENVHDAMWARIELYIKNDDRYEKVRCFSYIYLLDCIEHRRVAVVPTLEKLLNADGSGVSERFEDEEEEEFLKLLLSDYDDMFSIEEKKSN